MTFAFNVLIVSLISLVVNDGRVYQPARTTPGHVTVGPCGLL